jgi:integrase
LLKKHLSDFRDKLSESLSSKTYRNVYWLLTELFAVARDFDLIDKSPVRPSLHRPRRISKKEKPRLSSEETLRVLQEIPNEHRLIFVLDVVIAVRAGELLGLRWLDFLPERQTLSISSSVWRGKLGTPKTEASVRTVHMPSSVGELLKAHREASSFNRDEDFIFARSDGRPYDQDHLRNMVLYPALQRAGIDREPRSYGFHLSGTRQAASYTS